MRSEFRKIIAKFRSNIDASIVTMFGVSAPLLLMIVGLAYDTSQLNNTKGQAQLMADAIGLNASIYVKNNDGPPTNNDKGYLNNTWYNANDLDLSFGYGTVNGNSTRFKVVYDDVAEEAIVTIESSVEPVFMQVAGFSNIEFTTTSVIKYAKKDHANPASIFLVIDNSGSMAFDDMPKVSANGPRPVGAKSRISGLKTELIDFNEHLSSVIVPDPADPDRKFLRMGMTAYNTNIINSRTVNPHWGTISKPDIDSMVADGGTVPTNALAKIQGWMAAENNKHEDVNGSEDPLKYVVLMADGANSYSNTDAQALGVCTSLKNSGVEIFSIGYALEPGHFYAGSWGIKYNSPTYYISPTVKEKAQSFLRDCASSDNHFLLAEDTDALRTAFDKIGAEIVEDAIRITQ